MPADLAIYSVRQKKGNAILDLWASKRLHMFIWGRGMRIAGYLDYPGAGLAITAALGHPQPICSALSGLHLLSGFVGLQRKYRRYGCFALRATLASPRCERYI